MSVPRSIYALIKGDESGLRPVIAYSYDREKILPYRYQVYLDNEESTWTSAPSHQSAVYSLTFEKEGPAYLVFNSRNGQLQVNGNSVSGYQYIDKKNEKSFLYAETNQKPVKAGVLSNGSVNYNETSVEGTNAAIALSFGGGREETWRSLRYLFLSARNRRRRIWSVRSPLTTWMW